jgi:hydrophobic/amphiphilic exporter-1 (mainly G- bacteria), HAE1 family
MQWLSNISVRRPIFASVLMLVILVIGAVGYFQLGVDRFPKVDFPSVVVVTRLPGSAPEEIETEITDKIEEAVNTIDGIDELRSVSSEGVSQVTIVFRLEKDGDVAAQEVRDRIGTIKADLPSDAEEPAVLKMDPDATPIIYVSVKADQPIGELTRVADEIVRRRIENVPGVGQVNVVGGAKRQINVVVDAVKLRGAGLTVVDVERAIANQNVTVPGGAIETGPTDVTLRVKGKVDSPAALGDFVIKQVDGHPVRIADVARIEDGLEDAETSAAWSGTPAVVLSVRKQSGSNTVEVVDAVRARLDEMKGGLPSGATLEVVRDNSITIRTSVHAVKEHLILGGVMAAIVVLLFLGNLRSTVIAAVAIPISIVGTFALMWVQGFTLDTITLLALALAVGIVIDDAIVVLENVHRYIHDKHIKPFPAAILATKEIGMAVLATTLSLIAVFLPVAFMGGMVGRFLKSFGVTMAFSIGVSLIVSFTLTPMLSARWMKPFRPALGTDAHPKKSVLDRIVDVWYVPMEKGYVHILGWVMRHRWVVVTVSVLSLVAIVPLGGMVRKGFLPRSDEAHFEVSVRTPEGSSLEATRVAADRIARDIREVSGVRATLVTIGDNDQKTPNLATIYVKLIDPEERPLSQEQLMAKVRNDIVAHQPEELRVKVAEVAMFAGSGAQADLLYAITGTDLETLEQAAKDATDKLRQVPGAVDVDTSLRSAKPELGVTVHRAKAADLGVQVVDVARALRLLVGGAEVSTYSENGNDYEVHIRADERFRISEESLALVSVPSSRLGSVPLLDVVKMDAAEGPGEINRMNRKRQVQVTANVAPGYGVGETSKAFEKIFADLELPSEYTLTALGTSKEMGRAAESFIIAFAMSIIFMYLVLAAQMESWLHPVTILLTLPLTLPFALVSLLIFDQALDIYSALGILVLFGVVKKNSILQVDHTNALRAGGMERLPAILEANRDRLRPILMTTLAFVAGMLPLMFSNGIGAGFNKATAGVVVGGQTLSLLLTLLATPVAYSLFDDAAIWLRKRFPKRPETDDESGAADLDAELARAGEH